MWICSECGKYNFGGYCEKCGKHHGTEDKVVPSLPKSVWTVRELVIIALTVLGVVFLLVTPLLSAVGIGESLNLNNLAFGDWNNYVSLSSIFNYFEQAGWAFLAIKFAAGILYVTIIVTLVETVKKLSPVSTVMRWVSLGVGVILLGMIIWVKSKVQQDWLMSYLAGYLKYGFGGILLGMLFLGSGIYLSFRTDLFNKEVYKFGETAPDHPIRDAADYVARDDKTARSTSPDIGLSTREAKPLRGSGFEDFSTKSPKAKVDCTIERRDNDAFDFSDTEKAEPMGKLKSTLRTHVSKPFENDEAAAQFKRPNDL